jgi:L-arabinonolactonase
MSRHERHRLRQLPSIMKTTLVDRVSVGNTLGEGVLWDSVGKRAWWTDIQERRLYRYQPVSQVLEQFNLPERLGSFGFIEGSDRIIAAFESGFALYHPESAALEWIARPQHAAANVRFNDGRVDRQGRFWAGSMVEGLGQPTGKLYCLTKGISEEQLTGIAICNSLCFSPDGRHMYFADSPHRVILKFDLDPATGMLSNRRIFARTPPGIFPDGSNVDSCGHLWNAQWGGGCVVRYAPDGTISGRVELPVTQPTCVAFGGDELDLLFVTSAREGFDSATLATQPHAGDVFIFKTDLAGCKEPNYQKD